MAESLDRSHAQVVTGLTLARSGKAYALTCTSSADAEVEVWAAQRHSEPFARLLGAPCTVEAAPALAVPPPKSRTRVTRN
jgi:hypothetical protein